jgi:hypothetical protein
VILLDKTEETRPVSRTAFTEEEIVGSADWHYNTLLQAIVKLRFHIRGSRWERER